MTKKYDIKYLPLFYNDLEKIIEYIIYQLDNKIAANNFIDELEEKINKRAYNPKAYEKYISAKERQYTYYRIYIKNYTVFYTARDNVMEVRRLLYSKRKFEKLIWKNLCLYKKIGVYVCIAYAPVLDSAFKCSYCSTTTLSLTKLIITESLGNSSFFKRLWASSFSTYFCIALRSGRAPYFGSYPFSKI